MQHLWSQRGEDAGVDGDRLFGRVQSLEVRLGRSQRLLVSARVARVDEWSVTHADSEQQALSVRRDQGLIFRGDVHRFVHPQVEDARCDYGFARGSEKVLHGVEQRTPDVRDPQCGVSQVLQFGGSFCGFSGIAIAQLRTPYAYTCELHGHLLGDARGRRRRSWARGVIRDLLLTMLVDRLFRPGGRCGELCERT